MLLAAPRDDVMWFKNKYLQCRLQFLVPPRAGGMPMLDSLPPTPFPIDGRHAYNRFGWSAPTCATSSTTSAPLADRGGKFSVPAETLARLTRNNASGSLQRTIVPWFWLAQLRPQHHERRKRTTCRRRRVLHAGTFLDSGSSPIHSAFIVSSAASR